MRTTALRLYGKRDLRLESFDLPEIRDDEILASVVTNSICMSDYKAVVQGAEHKRVTKDIAVRPIIIGHEQCGTILKVGDRWKDRCAVGQKYSIQPAVNIPGRESEAVGYSYPYVGGDATRIVIAPEIIERDCLIPYAGDSFFKASLSEPVACILAALKSQYHVRPNEYRHEMGIKVDGRVAILGGGGPMGLEFLDLLLHGTRRPSQIVLTDVDQAKLDRAEVLFPSNEAFRKGTRLSYINVSGARATEDLLTFSDGKGFDDVFVLVPNAAVTEQASAILGVDGCLNFFTGPTNETFTAPLNYYKVHYHGHHVIGSVGSTTDDMVEALELIGSGSINPALMITHIGGLDAAAEAILDLPNIPGGKKLIYTGISLPLVSLEEILSRRTTQPLFLGLAAILEGSGGLWSREAEDYLLSHAELIDGRHRDDFSPMSRIS